MIGKFVMSVFNTLKGVLGKALPLRAVSAERTL
jgi:hypothetical protein